MDRARSCANNCIFCFVDQMPKGMRPSLYFKDDDTRLSFLMGNYLTLTNLSQREIQRIWTCGSPPSTSLSTLPIRRCGRDAEKPPGGGGLDIMPRFAQHGITMNCQIVACPGINDGPALERTLADLAQLYPAVNSISVVPVGVTRYREGLYPLRPYTQQEAGEVLDQVERAAQEHREKTGTRLVWCSDEFYLLAGRQLPEEGFYEEFAQLDNGVGMLRLLTEEFRRGLKLMEPEEMAEDPFAIATGDVRGPVSGKAGGHGPREVRAAARGRCTPSRTDFFGRTITVAGLVTGGRPDRPAEGEGPGAAAAHPGQYAPGRGAGISGRRESGRCGTGAGRAGDARWPRTAMSCWTPCAALATAPPDFKPNLPEDEYYRYNPGTR